MLLYFLGFIIIFFILILIYFLSAVKVLTFLFLIPLTFLFIKKHYYGVIFLMIYIPLENVILKFVPSDVYFIFRYYGEVLVYFLFLKAVILSLQNRKINILFKNFVFILIIFFIFIGLFSALYNLVPLNIAVFGLRQILRMSAIFCFFLLCSWSPKQEKMFFKIFTGMIIFEAVLGIIQYLSGGLLDKFLLPANSYLLGEGILLKGITKEWAGGVRAFATLGRYERFSIFLLMGLFFYIASWYLFPKIRKKIAFLTIIIISGIVVSYTRSVWFSGLLIIPILSYIFFKDKKIIYFFAFFAFLFTIYINVFLVISNTQLSQYIDASNSSLAVRFIESFSYSNFKNSYYTWGRIYFWVETVRRVVPASPFIGFGPGQYGSGVTSIFQITAIYSRFNMPFGITNTTGMVDSNWMSVLGEYGILGFLIMFSLLLYLFKKSFFIFKNSKNNNLKILSFVVSGMCLSYFFLGFFWPIFEYRVINFYFWLLAGFMFYLYNKEKIINIAK